MKIICTERKGDESYFTPGKIYDWIDGTLKCDDGYVYRGGICEGEDISLWMLSDYYTFERLNDEPLGQLSFSFEELIKGECENAEK